MLTGEVIAMKTRPPSTQLPLRHQRGEPRRAIEDINQELRERLAELHARRQDARGPEARAADTVRPRDDERGRLLQRHRELLPPPGRAAAGDRRPRLFDYFPKDFLLFVDEIHVTVPQIGGMYQGDRSRKETLVEYGFRLPSRARQPAAAVRGVGVTAPQVIFVSATPGPYEVGTVEGSRGADHPADRPRRSPRDPVRCRTQVDRRSARRSSSCVELRRARAGHDADQAHGRGPDRVPRRARHPRALPALGHRDARARGDPPRPAARQVRRAGRASTCCARGSTCPKCRWWRSSMRTRRASCAPRPR